MSDIAPHNMTANNVPTPFVASASTNLGSGAGGNAYNAFDDSNPATYPYWLGTGGGVDWLQLDTGGSYVLLRYTIKSEQDGFPARAPKNWTFQGSNDGSSWTTLDTQTNQTSWGSAEQRVFRFTNSTAYRYYRLNISANNGDGTYTGIGEVYLYTDDGIPTGVVVSKANTYTVATTPIGGSVSKLVNYVVTTDHQQESVSKLVNYVVTTDHQHEAVSKLLNYVVTSSAPWFGASKVLNYVVLNYPVSQITLPTIGLTWDVKKTPIYPIFVQTPALLKNETRIALSDTPQYKFSLTFEFLREDPVAYRTECTALESVFKALGGNKKSFLLDLSTLTQDPDDTLIYTGGTSIGTTYMAADGTTTKFQLARTIPNSYSSSTCTEIIDAVNPNAFTLSVNGVPTTAYTLNANYGWVTFYTPPALGATITWTGKFYYRVRFADPSSEFALFQWRLWECQKVDLLQVSEFASS
jgi:hypothetical protein